MIKIFAILIVLFFTGCDLACNYKYIVRQEFSQYYTNSVTKLNDNCIVIDKNMTVCGTYSIFENPVYRGKQ